MVRINLLPYKEIKKKEVKAPTFILHGGLGFLFVLFLSGFYVYFHWENMALDKAVKNQEKRLAELNKIVGEIDTFKKEKQVLEKKLAVIAELEKNRFYPVQLFADVASRVPVRDMWLEKMEQKGNQLNISGVARDTFTLVRFIRGLESSALISSVELLFSKQREVSGMKLQEFSLTCLLRKGV
ncbi:MAG: PilN domain-containing protein [Syntrophales bacterium]|nr:PilN domain-containing protein [Syntrophales bacterium]